MSQEHAGEAKWAAVVGDRLVPLPRRRLSVRDVLHQSDASPDATLVRDFNSPNDIGFESDVELDLADGNVFRIATGGCVRRRAVPSDSPKLAFIVDDHWEVTIQPRQTTDSLRGLFGLDSERELLRDFESPNDEAIEDGDSILFADGPVFTTRKGENPEITIIVRGRRRQVACRMLSFDQVVALAYDPVRTGPFIVYTVSYSRGPRANREGDLHPGQSVKIKEGMVFCVTETDKS